LALPNRAAISRVSGCYEHWTVVQSISARTGAVRLCDSGNYRYHRKRSLLKPGSSRGPRLVPRDLFLISVTESRQLGHGSVGPARHLARRFAQRHRGVSHRSAQRIAACVVKPGGR
jgi:hypothetical protein